MSEAGIPALQCREDVTTLTPFPVMPSSELRAKLPSVLRTFRAQHASATPVVVGAHRKPEAAIIPIELFEEILPLLEDLEIARQTRERMSAGPAEPIDDLAAQYGVDFSAQ